ncbi:MAG TPA: amino acid permease [Terriglobales bacterium]|nr:amino acid permease [Terriglobales bacterium]
MTSDSNQGLAREIGLRDGIALVAGTIIGSGIFIVPAVIAQQVPQLSLVLLVWVAGAVLAFTGGLALGELGAMFPSAGGVYVYLRETFGLPVAFVYGWASFVAIESGGVAALSAAFSIYLGQLLSLSVFEQKLSSVLMILVLTVVNILGVKFGKQVQNVFAICKFGGLAGMCVVLLTNANLPLLRSNMAGPEGASTNISLFGVALLAAMWAYFGWHNVLFNTGEFRNPQRDLGKALVIGVLIVTAAYVLANLAYYAVLTGAEVSDAKRVAALALGTVLGPKAASLLALLIMTSVIGSANGIIMSSTRIPFAMAADGMLVPALARCNPNTKTPILAISALGAWAMVLASVGSFAELIESVVFTSGLFFSLAVIGMMKLRRTQPNRVRPFVAWGYPWLPALFVVAYFGLFVNTYITNPKGSLIGTGLVLLGVPAYYVFKAINARTAVQEVAAD